MHNLRYCKHHQIPDWSCDDHAINGSLPCCLLRTSEHKFAVGQGDGPHVGWTTVTIIQPVAVQNAPSTSSDHPQSTQEHPVQASGKVLRSLACLQCFTHDDPTSIFFQQLTQQRSKTHRDRAPVADQLTYVNSNYITVALVISTNVLPSPLIAVNSRSTAW